MKIIGIKSTGNGTNNQIRGLILEGARNWVLPSTRKKLLKDPAWKLLYRGSTKAIRKSINFFSKILKTPNTRQDLLSGKRGKLLHRENYNSDASFAKAVQDSVNAFCKKAKKQNKLIPEFVILPYDQGKPANEAADVDMLSQYVKRSFKKNKISVKTMVIASKLYDYKNVDLINVGKHQLSTKDASILKDNPELTKKVSVTLGVPSNLSWLIIKQDALIPSKKKELKQYKDKCILFSLGGKTENNDISFTIDDAKKLLKYAKELKSKEYKIAFTNSARTPIDVTDFLYENCIKLGFNFYNSKKLASKQDAEKNFRLYYGKYNKEFKKQTKRLGGNIYPGILKHCKAVINTHDSFSYTSDIAVLGITSIVYTENKIDAKKRPDCGRLFRMCQKKGYVISLDEAVKTLSQGKEILTKKMPGINKQLLSDMKKIINNQ